MFVCLFFGVLHISSSTIELLDDYSWHTIFDSSFRFLVFQFFGMQMQKIQEGKKIRKKISTKQNLKKNNGIFFYGKVLIF